MGRVYACVWRSCDVNCAWLMNGGRLCVAIYFDSMDQCTHGNQLLVCFIKRVAPSEGRWDVYVRVIVEAVMLVVHG